MEQQEINKMVDRYIALDKKLKELERAKEELKEQIVALGEGEHRTAKGKVSVSLSQRSLLDQKALKEAYGDALAPYYKTSASITVRVSIN